MDKLAVRHWSPENGWLTTIASGMVFLYALIQITAPDIADDVIMLGALLAWIAIFIKDRQLLRSFIVICFAAAIVSQLISWWFSLSQIPDLAERSPKVHRLAVWFYCIPVAYVLHGKQQRIAALLLLAAAGLLTAPWVTGDGWQELRSGLNGKRISFSIHNAQHAAMLFGVLLMGLLCFWRPLLGRQPGWKWLRLALWLTATVFCAACILFTQTRGVWLSLIVASATAYFILLLTTKNSVAKLRNLILLPLILLTLAGYGVSKTGVMDTFFKRLGSVPTILMTYWQDPQGTSRVTGISVRLSTWSEALVWIEKRPWIGWGGKGRRLVINNTDHLTESLKPIFGHLHNSYLDTAINYGLLGLSVMLALLGYLAYATCYLWKKQAISNGAALFFSMFIAYWLVVNLFESYMFYSSGSFILAIISGTIVSLYWKARDFYRAT